MTGPSRSLWVTVAAAVLTGLVMLGLFALIGHQDPPGPAQALTAGSSGDGAKVLLFRHALTDRSQVDADPRARGGCAQQRNLSAEGVTQAERIGHGLAELPVRAVFASPFCRTVDTARVFAVGEVRPTAALLSTTAASGPEQRVEIVDAGRALIDDALAAGDGVTVMVTHTQNIEALTGQLVEEGDAVVIGTDDGEPVTEAVIPAAEW